MKHVSRYLIMPPPLNKLPSKKYPKYISPQGTDLRNNRKSN